MTFLSLKETGYDDLLEADLLSSEGVEAYNVEDYPTLLAQIKEAKGQKTLVLDSVSGFQTIYFDWLIDEFYDGSSNKFFSYSEGPRKTAPQQMFTFENLLNNLLAAGTNVIILGHSKVTSIDNPLGDNYSQAVLGIDEGIRSVLTKWARAVLYYSLDVTSKNGKAKDESSRMIYTETAPGHTAKNRMGLPPYIPGGDEPKQTYTNLVSKFPPAIKKAFNG